jgi:hypothetical protein
LPGAVCATSGRITACRRTALVNEAYLRLIDARRVNWQNRTHFLAMSARLMRRVLVDYARTKGADKRGGDMVRVTLSEAADRGDDIGEDVIALNDALETLEKIDPRKGRIVEFRFFAGLTVEETAAVPRRVAPDRGARLDICQGVVTARAETRLTGRFARQPRGRTPNTEHRTPKQRTLNRTLNRKPRTERRR